MYINESNIAFNQTLTEKKTIKNDNGKFIIISVLDS